MKRVGHLQVRHTDCQRPLISSRGCGGRMAWESEWTIHGYQAACNCCGWETSTGQIIAGTVPTDVRCIEGNPNPRRNRAPLSPSTTRKSGDRKGWRVNHGLFKGKQKGESTEEAEATKAAA